MVALDNITNTATNPGAFSGWGVVGIVFYVLVVVALWKVFSKAGWPGILAIIPIVNLFILVKIGGMSAWLGLLYLIPIVNIIFSLVVAIRVGRGFGHGAVWSFFMLWILSVIGFFILGFGRSTYTKPV